MNKTRTTGLACALVAAGLAFGLSPSAATADDGDLLVLTDTQTQELAARLQLDPYGDLADRTYDPQGASPTNGADTMAGTDTATTGADTGTDTGTGTGTTTGDGSSQASLDAVPALKANVRGAVEGAQGMAVTVPVADPAGDYFTLHALGNISRRTPDGKLAWERTNTSFYQEWNLPVASPRFSPEPYPARIVMGFNAVGPFTPASDNGYATGDLTGDGVPDVVFTADVGTFPFRPFVKAGYPLPTGTFVTVLDGATGKTLWSNVYPGVYNITVVGKTLVMADSPTFNLNAPATSKVTLTGVRFDYANGALTPSSTWTYDTGKTKANTAGWASLKPLGGGLLAASWNVRRTTAAPVPEGHTLVLDTADGSVRWQSANRLYSRQLQLDSSRGRLVAMEQSDPNEGVRYEIAAYSIADGTRTVFDSRINALPIDLEVGDVQGDTKPEYAVSEDTLDPSLFVNANTIRALDGSTASVLWSRTVKRDPDWSRDGATAWGLTAVNSTIVADYTDDRSASGADNRSVTRYARLAALAGNNGAVKWEQRGVVASQAWAQAYLKDNGWRLRTVDTDQNIRTYNLGSGKQESVTPLQSVLSSGVVIDVNGDGTKDVVAGGQSHGVYAYDGASLLAGSPKLLWQATAPGQIHKIVKADVNGDGREDLVVAADTAVVALDSRTGKALATIDGLGQYVWTVAAADLDGDGRAEIVVPTDKVRVYGVDGKKRWEYAAPAAAGSVIFGEATVADGQVYAEYTNRVGNPTQPRPAGGVALKADGTVAWTVDPAPEGAPGPVVGIPMRGATFASPAIPYADGHAVVYTWFVQNAATKVVTTYVEIRDGRTGQVLHTGTAGGPWTLGSWFTGPEGLYMGSTASIRLYGANGADFRASTTAQMENAAFATGPNGVRYLLTSGAAFFQLFDPAIVTSSTSIPPAYGRNLGGNREMVVGDLDGDGKDELVSLNFDDSGTDRMAGLEGGGYSVPYTAIRSLTVFTLDPS
ncbi:FG-GAP repeat domain-containing protein [Monashia sp. NPDC004114]